MPKPKQFVKDNKKSKQTQTPETADEYLAAGVDFEEAGEKWRGGDAAKSTRFFIRAIDAYEEALKKFPNSFDLAYNKARVQYELTQHPRLAAQLPGSLLDLLRTALDSSRYALRLRQDNADVLFNTAQVLTSLAEATSDSKSAPNSDSIPLLEEAIELFQRCLSLQEYQHTESLSQAEATNSQDPPDAEEGDTAITDTDTESLPPQDERWATIVEPVTNDTLLDTLLAQLETLTTLCNLITSDSGRGLAWIEEYSRSLLDDKLSLYLQGSTTGRQADAALTRANFIASLADANFRSQRIDISTYEQVLDSAFSSSSGLDLSNDPKGLSDKAEALIAYNTSLRNHPAGASSSKSKDITASRWKVLTSAQEALTSASKLPSAAEATTNLAKIHLARGDVEILRFQLGRPSLNGGSGGASSYEIAAKNGPTLLKNAGTYYRGAGNVALQQGGAIGGGGQKDISVSLKEEAVVKEALALALAGDIGRLKEVVGRERNVSQRILEEAVDEGLVGVDELVAMGLV